MNATEHYTSITPFEEEHKHPECGCRLKRDENNGNTHLYLCPMHNAAPDLLEALQLIQGFDWKLDDSDHGREIKRRALAAIARAEPT